MFFFKHWFLHWNEPLMSVFLKLLKFNKLLPSSNCLLVLVSLRFLLIYSVPHVMLQLPKATLKNILVLWDFEKIFEMPLFDTPSSLPIACWFIFLAFCNRFILVPSETFAMISSKEKNAGIRCHNVPFM